MTETLKNSVCNSFAWTKHFNRSDYAAAFQSYCEQYAAVYREAASKTDAAALAEELLESMEKRRSKLLPWRRNAARVDDKMLLLTFLGPMLLSLGEEGKALAEALRNGWRSHYTGERYELAEYETILDGFNNSVMGFSLFGGK